MFLSRQRASVSGLTFNRSAASCGVKRELMAGMISECLRMSRTLRDIHWTSPTLCVLHGCNLTQMDQIRLSRVCVVYESCVNSRTEGRVGNGHPGRREPK